MASTTAAAPAAVPRAPHAHAHGRGHEGSLRKRRRSREPDWNDFYSNGVPSEVIVIEDSPEPEANTSRKLIRAAHAPVAAAAIPATATAVAAAAAAVPAAGDSAGSAQPARKRRRDDADTAPTQRIEKSASRLTAASSSFSTDRANSALRTSAPTSVSVSKSQQSQHDEAPAPPGRGPTTANDAKRRDVRDVDDLWCSYKPPTFPPKTVAEVKVPVVQDHPSNKNNKVDDDDGHFIVVPDSDLTEQYQVTRLLGQGTFGKVVEARDREQNKAVAIKIIRSVRKYRVASKIELRVLATLKANDAQNQNRCIHLADCFDYRGHICIVTELLGKSIFDFLKGNGFTPFPNSQIQSFARQLFTSVAFLHDLDLIHTDLKPENILLLDDSYQTFTYNRKIPSTSTTANKRATQRRVLLDTQIRLIDFGSATFEKEYHSTVVSTRHYRAPEIMLGLGWSFPCDIWSLGCILVEFFTGDALFQTHDDLEHLAIMEAVIGSSIDTPLVRAVNRASTRSQTNPAARYFKRLKLNYPATDTSRSSVRFVKSMKQLDDIIPSSNTFLRQFLDLLKKIFIYDPAKRITAKEALEHPWLKEPAQPDDGTEAAKIGLGKKRLAQKS